MSQFLRIMLSGSLYFAGSILCCDLHQLSAYVVVPRSTADTTDRMNAGGDPADRPGLRDQQRSPEYLDDWWGRTDYYPAYSNRDPSLAPYPSSTLTHPSYLHPYPNPYYYDAPNRYDDSTRYYRPAYPVTYPK
jgi:hypothetical protein